MELLKKHIYSTLLGGKSEKKTLHLHKNMKYLIHIILFVTGLGVTSPLLAYNDHRNAHVDSLEARLQGNNPPEGESLLRAYDELMRGYLPYDAQKAEGYGRKALALSYQLDAPLTRQYVLRNFGLLRYGREDFEEALRYFNQALAVTDSMTQYSRYTQADLDDARSALYGSIANVYNLQGKAHLAIHYYQQALPIFERNGWLESQAVLHHNIAELYWTMGNDAKAEQHYLQAIAKARESGDSLMVAIPQRGLVSFYIDTNQYDSACDMLKAARSYYDAHREEETAGYATLCAAEARLHLMEGHRDLAAASALADEAARLVSSQFMEEDLRYIHSACCEVAMARGQWQQALHYGLLAVRPDSLATDTDAGGYRMLAEIYIQLGQKEKAREALNLMYNIQNRYATDHYQSGLTQMEVLYETEKKEAQIATLAREHRLYGWLLIGAVGVVTFLVLFLIYRQMAYRRQKALLAAQVALETETKERNILARELHDSLGGMLSLLRLKITSNADDVLPLLDNTVSELRRVSHHLLPEELLRGGLVSALHDLAVSIPGARFQCIGDIALGKEQELVLYRCAYELVNNSLKHAQASHIDIQLMYHDNQVTLTVSDDGEGMKTEQDDDGIGLQNIRERIAPYQGQLHIISSEGEGTEINVSIAV